MDNMTLGKVVWDSVHERYGVIIEMFPESNEVRLDSDGIRHTDDLHVIHSMYDRGTKNDLLKCLKSYHQLITSYPNEGYPSIDWS